MVPSERPSLGWTDRLLVADPAAVGGDCEAAVRIAPALYVAACLAASAAAAIAIVREVRKR